MIYDFFRTRGDNEAIWDYRALSKDQFKNDNVQIFDTKWSEVLSAVTDRRADNILESLYKMQICVASLRSRDDIRRQEIRQFQIEVNLPRRLSRAESQGFFSKREVETRTDLLQQELRAKDKQRGKGEDDAKTQHREKRLHPLDHEMSMCVWRNVCFQHE